MAGLATATWPPREGPITTGTTKGGHNNQGASFVRTWSFGDVVFAHLAVERRRLQPQSRGRAIGAIDLSVAALERVQNGMALQLGQSQPCRRCHGACHFMCQPTWINLQGVT